MMNRTEEERQPCGMVGSRYTILTLTTMVIDIRIVGVELNGFIEAFEGLLRIPLLHEYTRNLDKTLCERRNEVY